MTTEIDLLPLPEGESSSFGNYEVHDNEAMIEYARANVARAIAAKDAEIDALRTRLEDTVRDSTNKIEALRTEAEQHLRQAMSNGAKARAAQARAERLAEALREAEEHINALTPEWYSAGQRVLAEIRAALAKEDKA